MTTEQNDADIAREFQATKDVAQALAMRVIQLATYTEDLRNQREIWKALAEKAKAELDEKMPLMRRVAEDLQCEISDNLKLHTRLAAAAECADAFGAWADFDWSATSGTETSLSEIQATVHRLKSKCEATLLAWRRAKETT